MADKRYSEALAALERVTEGQLVRPGLLLQTADLYLRLRRGRDARQVYEKALARKWPPKTATNSVACQTRPVVRSWTGIVGLP